MHSILISGGKPKRALNRSSKTRTVAFVRNSRGALIALPPLLYMMSVRTQQAWHRRFGVTWVGRLPRPAKIERQNAATEYRRAA
jgi:hypothetical protein